LNPSKIDVDPRILGQLLAAQSVFSIFSLRQKMGEFVCRAVEGVPGVASCAVCMPGTERPRLGGEPVPECADCDVPEGDIDHDTGHPCRLPSRAGIQIFPLKTQDRHFGFLLLKLEERERYAPYEPFISNLANALAVNIDRQYQKERLEAANVELRRYRVHLEAANKELEAFSYSVSHDLRAPLRAMDGFSTILLEEYAAQLPAEARRYLGLVRSNTQQMGHLIEDLLAFSRLSRLPLNKQTVAPADVVRQALAELHAEQEGRNVEIKIGELPECQADPALLKQAWVNLLSNALKFTRKREVAHIEIGVKQTGSECIYYIKDNGVGFDMQYVNKLFGVFQRLPRSEEYEGTGVGLAIVQRIVHRHGGEVWAEGKVGEGAVFYFTMASAQTPPGQNRRPG
jgi:signal transduction histidine kinase